LPKSATSWARYALTSVVALGLVAGAATSSSQIAPASAAEVNAGSPVTLVIEGRRYVATPEAGAVAQKGKMLSPLPKTPSALQMAPPPAPKAVEAAPKPKAKDKPIFEDFPEIQKMKDEGTLLFLATVAGSFAAKAGFDYLFPPEEEEEQPNAPQPVPVVKVAAKEEPKPKPKPK